MTVQAQEKTKKSLFSGILGGGKTIWVLAVVVALMAVAGTLTILGNAAATATYYVLGRDVPARTQITPDMLEPREAKVDGAPPNAYDVVDVQEKDLFSQTGLSAGDVISPSNTGPLTRISEDLPDNFVAASFPVTPENAVAGKVRKGDFIDIIAAQDGDSAGKIAKVVLQHVLVLDVTVAPNSIAEQATEGQEGENLTPGPESEQVRSGIPSVYTVGVTPEDATRIALVRPLELFVTLSANAPEQSMNIQSQLGNVFQGAVGDSSAGTYGSVFIKRYNNAFNSGNTFVDADGNVWRVNSKGVWQQGDNGLDAGDLPPGYLPLPKGIDFTDKDGNYWTVENGQWVSEDGEALGEGDMPPGYDPNKGFKQSSEADSDSSEQD